MIDGFFGTAERCLQFSLIQELQSFLYEAGLRLIFLLLPLSLQLPPLSVDDVGLHFFWSCGEHFDKVRINIGVIDLGVISQEVLTDWDSKQRVPLPLHEVHGDDVASGARVASLHNDGPEVGLADLLVADGAGPGGVVTECEVVEDAGPAEHVATTAYLGRYGGEQTDGGSRSTVSIKVDSFPT